MEKNKVVAVVLMLLLSLSGIVIVCLLNLKVGIKPVFLTNIVTDEKYLSLVERELEDNLKGYMAEDDLTSLLEEVNISQDITDIVNGFSNNAVDRRTDDVKDSFKEKLMYVLEISNNDTQTYDYIEKISTMYTNTIFPSTMYNKIAEKYEKYVGMLNMLFAIAILCVIVSLVLMVCHMKNKNCLLIGIYNIIIFGIILIIFLSYMNNIFVQNVRVTQIIHGAINNMLVASSIVICVLVIIAVILNLKFKSID